MFDLSLPRKDAHIHKIINTVSAIRSVTKLKESLRRICRSGNRFSKRKSKAEYEKVFTIFRRNTRIRSLFQVWLEMSHLDYCSANFLHVVGFGLISSFSWPLFFP